MTTLAKVEQHEELRKDTVSGAILLSDKNVVNEYKTKKAMLNGVRDVNAELNMLKEKVSKIDKVENDLEEIKALLRGLVK